MTIFKTSIEGFVYWEPEKREDSRGLFYRGFCREELAQSGITVGEVVQVNYSLNRKKGTFRGFHYQRPPFAEEKIIKCIRGAVRDFAVDLRKGSPTFLQYDSVELSESNLRTVLIPKGCAHGFIALSDDSELVYMHTAFYNTAHEGGVSIYDPRLQVRLPIAIEDISDRDRMRVFLEDHFEGIEI